MSQGQVIDSHFRPHPLLRSPHLQTVVPTLLRPLPALAIEIERWELPDGDFVDLGWFERPLEHGRIAVLVHGLTGGFESKYLRGLARRLRHQGWAGVILQLRGAGAEPNRLPRNYHNGDSADLHALLARLRAEHPQALIATVGWSLGGNIVLKTAGEAGADHPADLVAAASVPFYLEPCAQRLRRGLSQVYQRRLLRDLKAAVQRKAGALSLPAEVDIDAVLRSGDFFAFDETWTAPLNGFTGALDYYERCQSGPYLRHIRRPSLIVHALDDPFMEPHVVPRETDLAPGVTLELARHGGHVGFVAADRRGRPHYWLEARLAGWLEDAADQASSARQVSDS